MIKYTTIHLDHKSLIIKCNDIAIQNLNYNINSHNSYAYNRMSPDVVSEEYRTIYTFVLLYFHIVFTFSLSMSRIYYWGI